MNRTMKKSDLVRWAKQESKAVLRLAPLILIAILLVALFWRTDSMANSGLFQSSPVQPTETPTLQPTQVPTTPPTPGATAQPTTPLPTQTLPPSGTAEVTPTQTPGITNTPTPSAPPATITPVPSPTGGAGEASPTPDENQRYAGEDSNLKFEWGMLFDSVALFLSYAWLCCGGLLFLAIPLVFVVLWVASKRRQPQEE
jgi:cytoskeletal protein RodZ